MREESATDMPLVSILIPAYNHLAYVADAVESVWQQDYRCVELIIIDDGSTDDTYALLQQLAQRSPIPMQVFSQQNLGLNRTLNRLVSLASGCYLKFLASDDKLAQGVVTRHVRLLEGVGEKVAGCYGAIGQMDANGHDLPTRRPVHRFSADPFVQILVGSFLFSTITTTLKTEVVRELMFDPELAWEDLDFFLRLLKRYRLIAETKVAAVYRVDDVGLNEGIFERADFLTQYDRILDKIMDDPRAKLLGLGLLRAIGRARLAATKAGSRHRLEAMAALWAALRLSPRVLVYYPALPWQCLVGSGTRAKLKRWLHKRRVVTELSGDHESGV